MYAHNLHITLFWLTLSLLAGLFLHGCGTGGALREATRAVTQAPLEREMASADALFHQHRFAQAAERYHAIAARNQGEARGKALLGELRSLMGAGQLERARAVSAELSTLPLNEAGLAEKLLFDAHLSLESGDLDTALQTFGVIDEIQLDPLQRRMFHEDKARIYAQRGERRARVAELIALDPLLGDPNRRALNQQALLDELMQLSDADLDWLDQHATPETLGWTDLIRRARASLPEPRALDAALRAWRHQYPTHPLDDTLLHQFALRLLDSVRPPRSVAVLLPELGRIGKAATLIREGIRRAYRDDQDTARVALAEYASDGGETPAALYARIAEEGHDLIIGPLAKTTVAALAGADLKPTPAVLALNRVEITDPPASLFQFGLAPEDEAVLAADRAWREGQRVALTLTPGNSRGRRLRDAFKEHFEALGGVVAESVEYDPSQGEFTAPVKDLLNIDASERRHRQLTSLLGRRLEFEPRPRPDAQCIFLVAKTMQARQINPLFRFYRAGALPVYATSRVHSGRPRPALDIDLEGIRFSDIPAVLLDEENQGIAAPLTRLRALGEDAWMLARQIRRMAYVPDQRIAGKTGVLYIDEQRRIHRLLVWARFHDGKPVVIGYAEKPLTPASDAGDQPAEQTPLVGAAP